MLLLGSVGSFYALALPTAAEPVLGVRPEGERRVLSFGDSLIYEAPVTVVSDAWC